MPWANMKKRSEYFKKINCQRKDELKKYREKNNERIKNYRQTIINCPHCDKSMKKCSLNKHIHHLHDMRNIIQCGLCLKKIYLESLDNHISIYHQK